MPAKRVLSVGQCFADHNSIARVIRQHFDAEVVPAETADEALALLREQPFDLVLVNRVLEGDTTSGVDLVAQVKGDEALRGVPVMLVSNHDEPQREAVARGALPGFGKAALGHPQTASRLRTVLG